MYAVSKINHSGLSAEEKRKLKGLISQRTDIEALIRDDEFCDDDTLKEYLTSNGLSSSSITMSKMNAHKCNDLKQALTEGLPFKVPIPYPELISQHPDIFEHGRSNIESYIKSFMQYLVIGKSETSTVILDGDWLRIFDQCLPAATFTMNQYEKSSVVDQIMSHHFQNGECTQCGDLRASLIRDPQTGRLPLCPDAPASGQSGIMDNIPEPIRGKLASVGYTSINQLPIDKDMGRWNAVRTDCGLTIPERDELMNIKFPNDSVPSKKSGPTDSSGSQGDIVTELKAKMTKVEEKLKGMDEYKEALIVASQPKLTTIMSSALHDSLVKSGKLKLDLKLASFFHGISASGNFWVEPIEDPTKTFPAANAGEKKVVQPYFDKLLDQFTANVKDSGFEYYSQSNGKFTMKFVSSHKVYCLPTGKYCNIPTVGTRKPDIVAQYPGLEGVLGFTMIGELKPRGTGNFSADEIGQLLDTNFELMRQQPLRQFAFTFISDGVRFTFFRVLRRDHDNFERMFGLFRLAPAQLGFQHSHVDGYRLEKVIGGGSQAVVFACTDVEGRSCALKIFRREEDAAVDLEILDHLTSSLMDHDLPNSSQYALIPFDVKRVTIADTVTNTTKLGYVSLPVCEVVRPTPGGAMLSRANRVQLLNTLKLVHVEGKVVNADIKPANVLVTADGRAVLCDWGTAVRMENNPVRGVGTWGFSDYLLSQADTASIFSHDLKALVRTIFCNYTALNVHATNQEESADFWERRIVEGSLWMDMMNAAEEGNYDELEVLFNKL